MTERKEAVRGLEWFDAKTYRDPKWPIGEYAPGEYIAKCHHCGGRFINMDKRATACFPCAVEGLQAAHDELRAKLRAVTDENTTLKAAIQIVARPLGGKQEVGK